ncbi:MAG: hypothetical protein LBJ20_02150 [Candidatus Methanoplasma sp.]|jgi:hypothetical protein|nr:hypothetical protein [Candidatus Methanoplasma sp.]
MTAISSAERIIKIISAWNKKGIKSIYADKSEIYFIDKKGHSDLSVSGPNINGPAICSVLGLEAKSFEDIVCSPREFSPAAQITRLNRGYLMRALDAMNGCDEIEIIVEDLSLTRISGILHDDTYIISYISPLICNDSADDRKTADGKPICEEEAES